MEGGSASPKKSPPRGAPPPLLKKEKSPKLDREIDHKRMDAFCPAMGRALKLRATARSVQAQLLLASAKRRPRTGFLAAALASAVPWPAALITASTSGSPALAKPNGFPTPGRMVRSIKPPFLQQERTVSVVGPLG